MDWNLIMIANFPTFRSCTLAKLSKNDNILRSLPEFTSCFHFNYAEAVSEATKHLLLILPTL